MIVVLGNFGVGKTQLIRALNNESFIEVHEPTIGVDFKKILIDETDVMLWEITGGERFITSITPGYLRKADLAIIMYDVSYAPSFHSIKRCIDIVKE
jgi:Ras-related protein Rab-6A